MNSIQRYPKIGIVGGAGPMAGILLFQKIIQICQEKYGCQKDADFPYITLLNYPFAEMMENIVSPSQKNIVKEQLNECLTNLSQNRIKIVTIACNTLHAFLDPEELKNISLVHMIHETALSVRRMQLFNPLVLCTMTSAECKLHKQYFNCLYPEEKMQLKVQNLINKILAGKQCQKDARELSYLLNTQLISPEGESTEQIGIVLGCTEFSVFNEQFPLQLNGLSERFVLLDPNQIIAEKICSLIFDNINE